MKTIKITKPAPKKMVKIKKPLTNKPKSKGAKYS